MALVLVGLGGALGAVAHYLVDGSISAWSSAFPFGTLVVNVTGSFLLGVLFAGSRGPALLVRMYLGEHDQWRGRPLYQAVVETLRVVPMTDPVMRKARLRRSRP
ncbi:MAG: CrcB family protein [Chloroflexota bacterium]|nr:CrcB family protein [Chloroflexota bacterium]MDE3103152.1 CrcB family protein [Chloroflexota bacterium]